MKELARLKVGGPGGGDPPPGGGAEGAGSKSVALGQSGAATRNERCR